VFPILPSFPFFYPPLRGREGSVKKERIKRAVLLTLDNKKAVRAMEKVGNGRKIKERIKTLIF
jgi:hypothetical protein